MDEQKGFRPNLSNGHSRSEIRCQRGSVCRSGCDRHSEAATASVIRAASPGARRRDGALNGDPLCGGTRSWERKDLLGAEGIDAF